MIMERIKLYNMELKKKLQLEITQSDDLKENVLDAHTFPPVSALHQ